MAKLFNLPTQESTQAGSHYSRSMGIPQYTPSGKKTPVESLCDYTKYSRLLAEINASTGISDAEKKFLKLAAARHIVFDYGRIADYYANASAEMQELMEKSALVILDIDDAIANGYVRLSKDIDKLLGESGVPTGE